MSKKPNILLIITDQQRADYLGCTGHPILKTPNIDSLAANGTLFDRFYASSPVCMPNRSTMMTGRMPSAHGVRHNGIPLSLEANTFVELLREAGYRTGLIGKSHLQNMYEQAPGLQRPPAPEDKQRIDGKIFESAIKPNESKKYEQEKHSSWLNGDLQEVDLPFYGFDHAEICTHHGDTVGGHYWHWLKERCDDPDKIVGKMNAQSSNFSCPQCWRTSVPQEFYPTSFIKERSIDYIKKATANQNENPFFLQVSFTDPHHPFTPPGKYWDMYDPAQFDVPDNFFPSDTSPRAVKVCHSQRASGEANIDGFTSIGIDQTEAREAMALTCGMISMIDDAVGDILQTLVSVGERENTIVIFTSDHGEFLGDHGLLFKGPIHYQSVIRVPFIWSDPKASGGAPAKSNSLASTIDIPQSILDRVGIDQYFGMQGRSLLPELTDGIESHQPILIEEDQQRKIYGFNSSPRCRTLVSRDYRLTLYQGEPELGELYHLRGDPGENFNLWSDGAYLDVRQELVEQLAHLMMDAVDWAPLPSANA